MDIAVTFRHMDATEALKAYARDRLSCVKKYFPDPIMARVDGVERMIGHGVAALILVEADDAFA